MRLKRPVRYGISHRSLFPDIPIESYLAKLFDTSADIIQFREKDLDPATLDPLVARGAELALRTGKIFLVNSATGSALYRGADGVHLTSLQNTGLAREAAERAGRRSFIVGKSVHNGEEALEAERVGADYLLLGPVFEPISKEGRDILGLARLRRICLEVAVPVFALGGITRENWPSVIEAGAAGFAGISWIHREMEFGERVRDF